MASRTQRFMQIFGSAFYYYNYAGVLIGAFTFLNQSQDRKNYFLLNALKHFIFMGNSYFIFMQKLKGFDHTLLLFLNDTAAFLCCAPAYSIYSYALLKAKYENYRSVSIETDQQMQQTSIATQDDKNQNSLDQLLEQKREEYIQKLLQKEENDKLNESEIDVRQNNIFQDIRQWYYEQNKPVAQTVELSGYGLLAANLLYIIKLRYRK
ncbi:UNKNOWN [Stylonychia lemnae]|uniref:Transmembrane protein n=1 Tax=Stylonychia lemnae TaxID=5949 RepID=A0A078A9U2_STYLE|nr:UNKNOWN [Stylonychia lemnae]|eukprot:CDW78666.1 UNKNOWN [Stylonychia lemnae]